MTTTILLLASNSKETDRLRLAEEFREIKESLKLSPNEDDFNVVQGEAVRPKDLRRLILETEPQIVHFSGHGSEAGIFLENYFGKSQVVSSRALSRLFKLFDSVHCVVLNACYSAEQAESLRKVTSYVVGMKSSIGDRAAIQFSRGFYDGLGAELSIEYAFNFGVNAIELNRTDSSSSRTFAIDASTDQQESNMPVLLKGSIKRPIAVSKLAPTPDKKGWSLSAFLKLPLFKIGFSISVTLLVLSSVMPLLTNYQDTGDDTTRKSADDNGSFIASAPPAPTVHPKPKIFPPVLEYEKPKDPVKAKIKNQHYKLEVSPQSLVLFLGTSAKKLQANFLTLNNKAVEGQTIQWRSADSSIASVRPSASTSKAVFITGHKKGKTKIYVEVNNLVDIISVEVK